MKIHFHLPKNSFILISSIAKNSDHAFYQANRTRETTEVQLRGLKFELGNSSGFNFELGKARAVLNFELSKTV